jgi:hypothetical protein
VANANVFDAVHFCINDRSGNFSGLGVATARNWIPLAGVNWFVAYAFRSAANPDGWNGWDSENMRATLTVLGTSVAANVGLSVVDVEWFAIRLSNQHHELPH